MPSYELSGAARKVLKAIYDAGGGGALSTTNATARLLCSGEYVATNADLLLRLVAFGYLAADGKGRLQLTAQGRENVALPQNVVPFAKEKGDA